MLWILYRTVPLRQFHEYCRMTKTVHCTFSSVMSSNTVYGILIFFTLLLFISLGTLSGASCLYILKILKSSVSDLMYGNKN